MKILKIHLIPAFNVLMNTKLFILLSMYLCAVKFLIYSVSYYFVEYLQFSDVRLRLVPSLKQ